ncbi:hypothetical protein TNCV_3258941 [Trichonephila clavipes]|nr:hypothetical protein TNCV_3258941 [Trichonephila clavipes]
MRRLNLHHKQLWSATELRRDNNKRVCSPPPRHRSLAFVHGQAFVAYPHRPITLHSPTENSLTVLNHKILEANSHVQNVKLGGHPPNVSFNKSIVTCCAVLLEPQLLDIMIVQFRNEKDTNLGSIPITIDCNVVAFIFFEEGFHQPIKRTKQSVFLDVTVFRHTLVD